MVVAIIAISPIIKICYKCRDNEQELFLLMKFSGRGRSYNR
jgi:hypothetical protein